MNADVSDPGLAESGVRRIEWADRAMPVLRRIRERFAESRPLAGLKVAACMHVTTETANLIRTLQAGGGEIALAASNPLSTQDDTAAALVAEYGAAVFARQGVDRDGYYRHIHQALEIGPDRVLDDGCDLVNIAPQARLDGRGDRPADAGPGGVPLLVAPRLLTRVSPTARCPDGPRRRSPA